jgi:hypothetical protein
MQDLKSQLRELIPEQQVRYTAALPAVLLASASKHLNHVVRKHLLV